MHNYINPATISVFRVSWCDTFHHVTSRLLPAWGISVVDGRSRNPLYYYLLLSPARNTERRELLASRNQAALEVKVAPETPPPGVWCSNQSVIFWL